MSNQRSRKKRGGRPERRIRVEGVLRERPDIAKVSRAVLAIVLAEAQAEKEAQAQHENAKSQGTEDDGGSS